jgi:hypothetical protein
MHLPVFTIQDRDRLRDRVLELAARDPRVVSGAVVGSLAHREGDRWSDLDVTFGVVDGIPILDVLDDWTRTIVDEFGAAHLLDLPSGTALYRVFVLPNLLQFDLSFAPAADFGAIGPDFRLLFGEAVEKPHHAPPSVAALFGYAVHHALRARFCIERQRHLNAEYWISAIRDYALGIACLRHGLDPLYGRHFDELPDDVREPFESSLVTSLDRDASLRALVAAIDGLLREAEMHPGLADAVKPQLRRLKEPWSG